TTERRNVAVGNGRRGRGFEGCWVLEAGPGFGPYDADVILSEAKDLLARVSDSRPFVALAPPHKPADRFDVLRRMRHVRRMPRSREDHLLRGRHRRGDPSDDGRKERRTSLTAREERRSIEAAKRLEIDDRDVRILQLVEKGQRVVDQRVLFRRRQLVPRPRSERDIVDELPRGISEMT